MLVHARRGERNWATVGLGVNLTATPKLDDSAPRPATSLAEHLPASASDTWLTAVASSFVTGLAEALVNPGPATQVWRARLIHQPGDPMKVRLGNGNEVAGDFVGVTEEGFLRVRCAYTERIISSGDIIE